MLIAAYQTLVSSMLNRLLYRDRCVVKSDGSFTLKYNHRDKAGNNS
jgi:hypothetical protein